MGEEMHEEAQMGATSQAGVEEAEAEAEEGSSREEAERGGGEAGAAVDRDQSRWLAALQSLGVVEEGVGATAVCTRGEYARSLMASTTLLTRYSCPRYRHRQI